MKNLKKQIKNKGATRNISVLKIDWALCGCGGTIYSYNARGQKKDEQYYIFSDTVTKCNKCGKEGVICKN